MVKRNGAVARIAAAVPEQRRELELSLRELARLSGVSRDTVAKVDRGEQVRPSLLLQIASTLTVLELYRPPATYAVDSHGEAELLPRLLVPTASKLLTPAMPTFGGAA